MPDPSTPLELLTQWLDRKADDDGRVWLYEKCAALEENASDRVFFTTFSAVPRYLSKDDLELRSEDLRQAERAREGWSPAHWSISQAGRTVVLLSAPADERETYAERVARLASAADVGESVALYQSLPLLPHPERWVNLAAEGLRSNMTAVFNAVALRNPYPAEHFSNDAWNQLVLKAVFVESPLYKIYGLDERANKSLARMLVDYAHERWAAGRSVTPELWRPVGLFADDEYTLDALERALNEGEGEEQRYAALALSQSPSPRAENLLADHPELLEKIEEGEIDWPAYDASEKTQTDIST